MAEYIVVGFPGQLTASRVLKTLEASGEMELNVEAVAIASRDKLGRVQVHQLEDESQSGAVAGGFAGGIAGLLIGAIAANPIAGIVMPAVGAMTGAMIGDTHEIGLDDEFTKKVGRLMEMDSSVICFMFWDESWDAIPEQIAKIIQDEGGSVVRTTLSVADENELKDKLGVS